MNSDSILRSYANGGWIVIGHKEVTEPLRDPRVSNYISATSFLARPEIRGRWSSCTDVDAPTMLGVDVPGDRRSRS